nr:hypothetical protein CFP56_27817 [Quercus suber]
MEDFKEESSASSLGIFVWDSLRKNLLLPYWGYLGEESSTSSLGICFGVLGSIGEESFASCIDAWNIEEESSISLLRMVFDKFDPFEEESFASCIGGILLEILEILRKNLLLPY